MYTYVVPWLREYAGALERFNYNLTSLLLFEVVWVETIELYWAKSKSATNSCFECPWELLRVKQIKVILRVILFYQHSFQVIYFILVNWWGQCYRNFFRVLCFSLAYGRLFFLGSCYSSLTFLLCSINHSLLGIVNLLLVSLNFFISRLAHSSNSLYDVWVLGGCGHLVPTFVNPLELSFHCSRLFSVYSTCNRN